MDFYPIAPDRAASACSAKYQRRGSQAPTLPELLISFDSIMRKDSIIRLIIRLPVKYIMYKEALLNEEIHLKLTQLLSKEWGILKYSGKNNCVYSAKSGG